MHERPKPLCRLDRAPAAGIRRRGRSIALQAADPVYRRQPGARAEQRGDKNRPPQTRLRGFGSGLTHRVGLRSRNWVMANRMWGGRFGDKPDEILEEINASIDFDRVLYAQDIAGSKAHVSMLAKQGIIGAEDAEKIARGLDTISSEIESGKFKFTRALEDIHTHVEARLAELIGPAAGRLHTARSRNDQVATDTRLYVRDAIDRLDQA